MDNFMNVLRYTPPQKEYYSKFRWNGDTAEEAYTKGIVKKYPEYWEFRTKYLSTVKDLFDNTASLPQASIDMVLSNTKQNKTWESSAVIAGQNVYLMQDQWSKLDDIVKGRMDGSIYSYDTETLGDFDNAASKLHYVTELGLARHNIESGVHIKNGIENVENISLAFGIDDNHYDMYKQVVDKITKGSTLTQEEEVIAKRAASYAGNFDDRFKMANAAEQDFLKSMGFKNTDVLLATTLAQDTSYKDPQAVLNGLNNLRLAGQTSRLNDGIGKETFEKAIEVLSDAYANEDSVITVYNGAFDVNAINKVLSKFKMNSPLLSKQQNLDMMNALRAASASRGMSVSEYVQNISKAKGANFSNELSSGGTLEDLITALGFTGEFHNAGSDASNTATLASIFNFFTVKEENGNIPRTLTDEALMAARQYALGENISLGDTVFFKRDANLDINSGDFAIVNGNVVPSVSTTSRYWTINDIKRMNVPDTSGQMNNKYVIDFKNAAYQDLDMPEVHVVKTFDTAEDSQNFLLTNTVGANKAGEKELRVSQKDINAQQRLMDYDKGRREWDRLWDTNSVEINGSTGQNVGGFNDLVKFNEFHTEFMKDMRAAKEANKKAVMPNSRNIIYSSYDEKLNALGKTMGMNSHDIENYKYMFAKFENQSGLLNDIISEVSSVEGLNNLQKTRVASKMYDTFNESIAPGSKIGSHITVLSNLSNEDKGYQALKDINYMSVIGVGGKVNKINVSDVTIGVSELKSAFTEKGASDRDIIDNMITGMEGVAERGNPQIKKDLKKVIADARDYIKGNNTVNPHPIATMFSAALNRNLDVSNADDMTPVAYGKYVDFVNKVGSDSMFGDEQTSMQRLQNFFGMNEPERKSYLQDHGVEIEKVNSEVAYAINAKTIPGEMSLGEKSRLFRNGTINYTDSRGNINEISINEARQKSWYKNIQETMSNAARDLQTAEKHVLFPNVGLSTNNTQLLQVSRQIAAGMNYDKLNNEDYEEAIKTIGNILVHSNKDDPTRSYGLLNIPNHQTVVFHPESINGDTFFVTTPQKNFSRVYDTMRDLAERSGGMSSKQIEDALVDSDAAVLTFKKLNVKKFYENQYSTSVTIGKNNQEKFLTKSITSYIGNKGSDVGRIYADIESGEIQLLHTYRQIGADYIGKLSEGNYKEATRIGKKGIDNILSDSQGAVDQQTIVLGDKAIKKVLPNLADMSSSNVISMEGLVNAIPEMVKLDPNNEILENLLVPFIPSERYNNNKRLNYESATAAVNSPGFKEFFYKHMITPVKNDYIFTANNIATSKLEDVFGNKNIFQVLNSVVLGNGKDQYLHHGGKSLPNVLQQLSNNPYVFGALKETQVDKWKISLYNPLLFNEGSMFDAFARPVNMQQLTLKYFDPFAEGNRDLHTSEQIARVGSISMSRQEFMASMLRKTSEGDEEIAQRFSERKIMTYIRQADDLDIAEAFAKFDGNENTLKQKIISSLRTGNTTEDAILSKTVSGLNDNVLDALYGIMKNEMSTNYEGSFLMRPSIWNNDYFRVPDIRNVKVPELLNTDIRGYQSLKNQIIERIDANPNIKEGEVIASAIIKGGREQEETREIIWNGESGTILNPDEFIETGVASVMPDKRAIGDAKVIAGNEKAMAHSISYDLYDSKSKISQLFPELSEMVQSGKMSFEDAKKQIDPYTDLLMSGIFGQKTGVVANMGVFKHLTGSMVYNSKLNVILNEATKDGDPMKIQSFINELNLNGFKDWNFKIEYDDNKNLRTPKPVLTYDFSEMIRDKKTNGYITEVMNLESMIRQGKIGSTEFQENVIRELDQLDSSSTVLTSLGRALNQEKMGEELKLNSRLKNAESLIDDMMTMPVVGYNAFEDGKLYADVFNEHLNEIVYGAENTIRTEAQVMNLRDAKTAINVLRSMETSLEYMDHAQDIINAQNVVSVHFNDLSIPKSGVGKNELQLSIFGINGKPSEFIQRIARTNGNKDVNKVNILNVALPQGLTVNLRGVNNEASKVLDNVLIPLQNIEISKSSNVGFYTRSQSSVVRFLNTVNEYKEGLNTGKDINTLRDTTQKAFEEMYSFLQSDLGTNSKSMYTGLIEKVGLPNSGQFSAQKIDSPVLREMTEPRDEWGGRNLKQEYNRIKYDGVTSDMSYEQRQVKIFQNTEKANKFQKEVMESYADRIRKGEVLDLVSGKYITKGTKLVDGKLVEMDMYDTVTTISRGGVRKLGLDKAGIGVDIYKDMTSSGELVNKVSHDWIGNISKDQALDKFIEEYGLQTGTYYTRGEATKLINENTFYNYKYTEKQGEELITKTGIIDFGTAIEELRVNKENAKFNGISIKDLNMNLKQTYSDISRQQRTKQKEAQRIENAFGFLREKYLSEVGIIGIDLRDPTFHQGSTLPARLKLDLGLSSDSESVMSSAFGAFAQNLDLDGDKKMIAALLDKATRLMNKDDKQSQAMWGLHNIINTRNNELLAQLLEGYKFADDLNNPFVYTMSLIKTMSPDIYEKMSKEGFDYNSMLEGISEYSYKYGNMLTNEAAIITGVKAKVNKSGIGSFSIPNFRIRTILEDLRGSDYMDGKTWRRTLRDLAAFTEDQGLTGLLTFTEQTGIDVKHNVFSDYIAETPMWNSGMNKLFMNVEGERPDLKLKRQEQAITEMLTAAGPKLSNDADYVIKKKNVDDAKYILQKTRDEIGEELEFLIEKGKILAKGTAERESNDQQIEKLLYIGQMRSLYDFSQVDAVTNMYSANLVGSKQNIYESRKKRKIIANLREKFGDFLSGGRSSDARALQAIHSEVLPSLGIDPLNDVFISKENGYGYSFKKYSHTGTEAIFQGVNINATIGKRTVSYLKNVPDIRINVTGNAEEALSEQFINTRLRMASLVRFKLNDEVNGAQYYIEEAAKELAVNELTNAVLDPYAVVSERRKGVTTKKVTARQAIFKYDPDIENLIQKNKVPEGYSNKNRVVQEKYRIMSRVQPVLYGEDGIQVINGYLNVAQSLYGDVDSKNLIRQINRGIIDGYNGENRQEVTDTILRNLKHYVSNDNSYQDSRIKTITSNIINSFKDEGLSGEDSFGFLKKFGNYRKDLIDTNEIERMLGGMNNELLNDKLDINAKIIAQRESELYGFIKNEGMLHKIFNLKDVDPGKRQITFGKYLGYSIEDLSIRDFQFIENELSKVTEDDSLKYYATTIAKKSISDYNVSNKTLIQFKPDRSIGDVIPEDVVEFTKKAAEEAEKNMSREDKIKRAFRKMTSKNVDQDAAETLTGRLKKGFGEVSDLGGKALAYGTMAMFAIGIASKMLHKDEDKSPLVAQGGGSAQNFSTSHGKVSPASKGKVIYTDSNSGLSYTVNAKSARYINDSDNAAPFSKAMNARLQIQSERDMTGVNQNWLQERMSDIF